MGEKLTKKELEGFMEEVLDEASDSTSIAAKLNSFVETFYGHALKYKHHPEYQTTTWVHTLIRVRNNIRDLYKNTNKVKISQIDPKLMSMDQLYRNGMKAASKDNPTCHNKYDVYKEFNSVSDIIAENRLESFLMANSYTIEVKNELNRIL